MNGIPVFRPHMPNFGDLEKYLHAIDEASTYTNFGPLSKELERQLAKYVGVKESQLCSVTNATLGILGLIQTAYQDKSVLEVPSWTFTATPAAIKNAGHTTRFVDVDLDNWESEIQRKSSPGVHVLPFGTAGNRAENIEVKSQNPLIIDAAASFANLGGS